MLLSHALLLVLVRGVFQATAFSVFNGSVKVGDGAYGGSSVLIIPSASTRRLLPGRYLITVPSSFLQSAKFSVAPQPIYVGPVYYSPEFKINQYGDYEAGYPSAEIGS